MSIIANELDLSGAVEYHYDQFPPIDVNYDLNP